jgi:hypothetical protein
MTDDAISEEMVEAGARAINPAAWRDDVPEQWKERQPMLRDIARKSARAALAAAEPLIVARERATAVSLLDEIMNWSRQRCPCENEKPDPCPLCGARVNDPDGVCKAGVVLPDRLFSKIAAAIRSGNGGA